MTCLYAAQLQTAAFAAGAPILFSFSFGEQRRWVRIGTRVVALLVGLFALLPGYGACGVTP